MVQSWFQLDTIEGQHEVQTGTGSRVEAPEPCFAAVWKPLKYDSVSREAPILLARAEPETQFCEQPEEVAMGRVRSMMMRLCALVTLSAFLISCTEVLPEQFIRVTDVYPAGGAMNPPPPPLSVKQAQLEAPYEDVFRAATVAAAQAQFNIEKSDKRQGLILAEQVERLPQYGQTGAITRYYAIVIKETGPKASRVDIQAKAQIRCGTLSTSGWVITTILTLGIALIMLPTESDCRNRRELHWDATSAQQMSQFISFTRNNLIAAGVL
jgi:hypothetical protein